MEVENAENVLQPRPLNRPNMHFTNICKNSFSDNNSSFMTAYKATNQFKFNYVNTYDVLKLWKYTKNKDNTKEDHTGMCNKMINRTILAPNITTLFMHFFNLSLKENSIPDILKISRIIPIPKKPNPTNVDFRPISIIPICLKLLEKLVYDQLSFYVNENKIINNRQFGFKKHQSTTTYMCNLMDYLYSNLAEDKICLMVSIDMKKAFDKVNRKLLIQKLISYGINCAWFVSYLSSRKQYVDHNNKKSNITITETGIPQGSALSGLLFTIFLNDMPDCCEFAEPFQYADDSNIVDADKPENRLKPLCRIQKDVDNLTNWLKDNYLELNESKTQMIMISNSKNQMYTKEFKIKVENETIHCVRELKCLGLYIDDQLNWKQHVCNVTEKCYSILFSLYPYLSLLTVNQRMIIIKSYILSNIIYLFVIWGNAKHSVMDSVNKLIKQCAKAIELRRKYDSSSDILCNYQILLPNFLHQFELSKIVFKQIHFNIKYFQNFSLPETSDVTQTRNNTYIKQETNLMARKNPKMIAKQVWTSLPDKLKIIENNNYMNNLLMYYVNEQNYSNSMHYEEENNCNLSCIDSVVTSCM